MKKQDAWRVAALCLSVAAVSSYITWRVVSANYASSGSSANGARVEPGLSSSKRGDIFTPDAEKPVDPTLMSTKDAPMFTPATGAKEEPKPKEPEVFRGTKSAPMIRPN